MNFANQMHPNPNYIRHNSDLLYSSHLAYFSQNPQLSLPFPLVYPDLSPADLQPPRVDSYPTASSVPQFTQYGADPAGYVPASPQGNQNSEKGQKKTKIVQSAYCEVCKVDCNSKDVYDTHMLGMKHKKNLEKLQTADAAPSVSSMVSHPPIGPQLDPEKATFDSMQRAAKNKATKPPEDLEAKRRKIIEGGAAQEAVRVCAICGVVCNSARVYDFHLAGKKHAAMLKKYMAGVLK